ncbi:glycoside hydrolase family 114 protein [Polychaeton citri CBS 116435]|uniref:alpha-galactosidase n=1 Tax=Polychaeton citri CBS 116435 TaxID=1314669 RepID=A0A9P4QK24_9PEZI|nr:glycoside hydrolase family 114 protein [Polychaeton citri CBS 116435]
MTKALSLLLSSSLACSPAAAWWKPTAGTTWQIILSQPYAAPYPSDRLALDGDLFDNDAAVWADIKAAGHKTICYFSAGSYEEWRDDADQFPAADLGDNLDDWPGERWVNTRSTKIRDIMKKRLDLAVKVGCDAVDPDNVDAYNNGGGGFDLTQADAIDYVKFLATEGHKRGLAVGLKNAGEIISSVISSVDFQVNEQCLEFTECPTFKPFIDANKPVFEIEYKKGTPSQTAVDRICKDKTRKGFSTLIKHLDLGSWYIACP